MRARRANKRFDYVQFGVPLCKVTLIVCWIFLPVFLCGLFILSLLTFVILASD